MAEEVLQAACVHTLGGQRITGRVAQHVDVNRERQVGDLTGQSDGYLVVRRRN
jgi:hypothetical protein